MTDADLLNLAIDQVKTNNPAFVHRPKPLLTNYPHNQVLDSDFIVQHGLAMDDGAGGSGTSELHSPASTSG